MKSLHHSFDTNLARIYGIEEAILIHHFQHWITLNARLKRNFHEGCFWTYQTIDEISAHFEYISKERIVNIIDRLCAGKSRFKKGEVDFEPVLKKGNFNKSKYDRTVWYAFCDSTKWILCEHKMENGETQNQDCGNTTPIPDTKTHMLKKKEIYKEKVSDQKEEFGLYVRLSKEEYSKLCEQHTEPVITDFIERINDYIASKGLKPYKDYGATIRNWLKNEDPKKLASTPRKSLKSFFDRFKEVYEGRKNITIGNDYVEFDCGSAVPSDWISFSESGAQERIENRLRKMGIYEKNHFL